MDDPDFERRKWLVDLNRDSAKREHDRWHELFDQANESAIKTSETALKAALIVNGGATVSILAFVGGLVGNRLVRVSDLQAVSESLSAFAAGVAVAVLAHGFAYVTHFLHAAWIDSFKLEWDIPYVRRGPTTAACELRKAAVHFLGVVSYLGSFVAFCVGVSRIKDAIMQLPITG